MAQSNCEADKMLDVYIYDYLLKRKLFNSAKAFMVEGKVATNPLAIDAPGGFLFEWWSVFWDIFLTQRNEKHSEAGVAYLETQRIKAKERQQQQQMQMQQYQFMQQRNMQLQQRNLNHPMNSMNSEGMMGQPSATLPAMKMYEERMKHTQSMVDTETSSRHIDTNRMALMKSASNQQGQLMQENSGSMSTALQQMQGRPHLANAILQSKYGLGGQGMNQGLNSLPLKGWPTGIDQLRPSSGLQMQRPNLQTHNQFLLASQLQQALAQARAQGNLGNATNYGSICSSTQPSSPKQALSQQQDQLQLNNRKRKVHSSSGPANSTGTGNTISPPPGSPQSTHTPGDGMATGNSLQHVNNVSKSMMMYGYGADGPRGIASSANQLKFGDVGSLEDVESFLSNDGGDGNLYGSVKPSLTGHKTESSKGFLFGEFGCIRTRNKVTCCRFSTDGKLLASAGHDKKAVLWNMDTLQTQTTSEEHQHVITDICFRPNSSQLATASADKSVRLWDAANPSYCLNAYTSHTSHIMSLDFHPKKNDLFCFCDDNNEVRYWSISPFSLTKLSKQGGSAKVRFQPLTGNLLAAASNNVVSIYDVENDRQTHSFQGHTGDVKYLCWDHNGDLLATVSENNIKVWSLTSGKCVHELNSNGYRFQSCVFHPCYSSSLLVIGGLRSMELWNMIENQSMTVPAHENIIAALAQSPLTGMVASASHDSAIKLWR